MTRTAIAVRQELHSLINTMPERKLNALRPLFDVLSENSIDDDDAIVIETDLTDEEHTLIAEGVKHYHEHPEDFVPLESIITVSDKIR
jgi:hypothetical protein